ncbi:hypothetical protein SCHPADRAFT_396096 [Schizopora paradoxa]|uniref:Uncharacterized protein n=1 Tax=Schizopora paradoxa TaxID=27342 RepID=A0A0H2RM17_9AGAM|nr:hypothetical protein SCHPADRAFT_396096 [Schizopora paradoxa]
MPRRSPGFLVLTCARGEFWCWNVCRRLSSHLSRFLDSKIESEDVQSSASPKAQASSNSSNLIDEARPHRLSKKPHGIPKPRHSSSTPVNKH